MEKEIREKLSLVANNSEKIRALYVFSNVMYECDCTLDEWIDELVEDMTNTVMANEIEDLKVGEVFNLNVLTEDYIIIDNLEWIVIHANERERILTAGY